MNSFLYLSIMVALWIVNLFNGTGLGQTFHTTEIFRMIVYIIVFIIGCLNYKKGYRSIKKKDFIIFGGMVFFVILSSIINGHLMMGINYLATFLLVYPLSKIEVKEKSIKLTGLVYLIMGMFVLIIFGYGNIFSGWNPNTIGMIGLYSYLIFMISYYNSINKYSSKIILILVTLIYIVLIEPTNSRSSTLFAIFAMLIGLSFIPKSLFTKSNKRYFTVILIPIFIAMLVVYISNTNFMIDLNKWSLSQFQKPIFNGRELLWERGFESIFQHFLIGKGTLAGNWHNCLITIFYAYGFLGGILWIISLWKILLKGNGWTQDFITSGCLISFFLMYIQQSVELGLVHESPNLLPYIVLGIMLGRVNFLNKSILKRGKSNGKNKYNYSSL